MLTGVQTAAPSEDGLDLRRVALLVSQHYRFIVGIALLAAVVGLGASFLQPKSYEGRALVAVTTPQYVLNFDPRFQSTHQDPTAISRALVSLATGDEVLGALMASASGGLPRGVQSVDDLRSFLDAKPTSDPSLVALSVRTENPEQSSALANAWADALLVRARSLYGQTNGDLTYFEARTSVASTDLEKAQTALSNFQARNQVNVLNAELATLEEDQKTYLADREAIGRLIADIGGLRRHLNEYPSDARVPLGDDLTALLLETKAFNANTSAPIQLQVSDTGSASTRNGALVFALNASAPIQLQVSDTGSASTRNAGELHTLLDDLESQLKSRASFDEARLAEIDPQILQVQGQVQKVQNEADRLGLERDIAKDTYQALVRQTEEVRMSTEGADGPVKIASRAVPPRQPASPRTGLIVAVAGCAGVLLGLAAVLTQEWWRKGAATSRYDYPSDQPLPEPVASMDGAHQ
jgi:uncharacterized protein involved in exopolysaccharide biosynthesis